MGDGHAPDVRTKKMCLEWQAGGGGSSLVFTKVVKKATMENKKKAQKQKLNHEGNTTKQNKTKQMHNIE